MPLTSALPELKKAQQAGYSLPLFDTFDMYGTQGIALALEETCSPGIIGLYSSLLHQPYTRALVASMRAMAQDAPVPVSLFLDHGTCFEDCMLALALGCTDVMLDASRLPLDENIAATRLVVRAAHASGACVEAELGHVGSGKDYAEAGVVQGGYTNPDDVERFVAETGVDCLAVAIGTAHGVYQGDPVLDIVRLKEIRSRVEVPLVLHGGSGLSDEQFREAVAAGICKVNVFTDLGLTAGRKMVEMAQEGCSYIEMSRAPMDVFKERCKHYLEVFGTLGRAACRLEQ